MGIKRYIIKGNNLQGHGVRKLVNKLLKRLDVKGIAVNDPNTGNVSVVYLETDQNKDFMSKLKKSISSNVSKASSESITATNPGVQAKIAMTEKDILKWRVHALVNWLRNEPKSEITEEVLKKFTPSASVKRIIDRYRLIKGKGGALTGTLPILAYNQLMKGRPEYKYHLEKNLRRSKDTIKKSITDAQLKTIGVSREDFNKYARKIIKKKKKEEEESTKSRFYDSMGAVSRSIVDDGVISLDRAISLSA